ncbi:MAG: helix-turn-helix domain-containing protein [Lachnotalea sp.]
MLKDNLIVMRNCKGISQEKTAEVIGISRQAYAKWEKGETIPDIEKIAKLASYYETTIDNLINYDTHQLGMIVPPAPKGKHIFGTTVINDRGQIVIPKNAREIMGIKEGDSLVILGDEKEGLALVKADLFEKKINILMEKSHKEIKE